MRVFHIQAGPVVRIPGALRGQHSGISEGRADGDPGRRPKGRASGNWIQGRYRPPQNDTILLRTTV